MVIEFDPGQWISGRNAAKLADVSLTWIRTLGERGDIQTLDTDLGRLYYKPDVEGIRRRRRRRQPTNTSDS